MKDLLKRAAALMAAAVMVFSLSATSFAEPTSRPRPGTTTTQTSSNDDNDRTSNDERSSDDEDAEPTKVPIVTEAPASANNNKNYTTKGGAFLWFLLSVIVNTAISFAIANRFYKLTRRSNHVQSELRALRRDLEEKFVNNVGGFVESNVDITNTNDDYSMGENGIEMNPSSTVDSGEETEDIYKQWEAQFGARYAARKAAVEEDSFEDEPRVRKYQPSRNSEDEEGMSISEKLAARRARRNAVVEEEIEEIEEEDFEEGESIAKKLSGVGNKAKQLLGGLFPFDDEEE